MHRVQSHRVTGFVRGTLVALCLVIIAGSARSDDRVQNAATPAREFFPAPSETELRYSSALQEPVTVTFDETPLEDVLKTLTDLTGVPIRFDVVVAQAGLEDSELTLTGEFTEVPLKMILESVTFEPEEQLLVTLLCYPAPDGIVLTLRNCESPRLDSVTRIYPVGDLCSSESDAEQLADLMRTSTGTYWKGTKGDGTAGLMINGAFYDSESDEIYQTMMYAGSISYFASVDGLIVQTSPATHAEILDLLRMIRQAKQAARPPAATASTEDESAESEPAEETVFTFTVPFTQ